MTATDELRRLLDERGVEWEGTPGITFWGNCSALDITTNETEKVSLHLCCTPEQAIAATLGNGTCRLEESEWVSLECPMYRCSECNGMFEDGRGDYRFCPYCGARVERSDDE